MHLHLYLLVALPLAVAENECENFRVEALAYSLVCLQEGGLSESAVGAVSDFGLDGILPVDMNNLDCSDASMVFFEIDPESPRDPDEEKACEKCLETAWENEVPTSLFYPACAEPIPVNTCNLLDFLPLLLCDSGDSIGLDEIFGSGGGFFRQRNLGAEVRHLQRETNPTPSRTRSLANTTTSLPSPEAPSPSPPRPTPPGNDDKDDIFRINDDIFRINDDILVINDDINIEETLECIEEAIEKIPDDCLECIGVAALSFALTALADGDAAAADTPIDDSVASELLGGLTAEIQEICFIGGGGGRPLPPGKDPDPVPDSPSGDPSKDPEPDSRSEDSATTGGDGGSDLILNGTSGGASSGGWNSFVALALTLSLSLVLGVAFMY